MLLPQSFEVLISARQADLLREAAGERRARQALRRPPRVRRRLAEALYNLAARLDPCAAPSSTPASHPA
jgi:hypothetical protein